MRREDIDLHVYGMPDWDPRSRTRTCLIVVDDTEALWARVGGGAAEAVRHACPCSRCSPRITRPRRRANAGGASGFSVVDPNGNWIRVFPRPHPPPAEPAPTTTSARAVENAVVLADSKDDLRPGAQDARRRRAPSRRLHARRTDRLAALALLGRASRSASARPTTHAPRSPASTPCPSERRPRGRCRGVGRRRASSPATSAESPAAPAAAPRRARPSPAPPGARTRWRRARGRRGPPHR